jgi:hypothetical protein
VRFVGLFLLVACFGLALVGCNEGVNQDALVESQKEINKSKGKGADAWQD